jgi:hypothetical protein
MERFFEDKNIARYRKLRDAGLNATQRAAILKELAEEGVLNGAEARPNGGKRRAARTER